MKLFYYLSAFLFVAACSSGSESLIDDTEKVEISSKVNHPEWSKDAAIYEVNIRQYTPEGTFNAFAEHLPRLKKLGTNILWVMPIQPIGEKNRKGGLGSYYSISDYTAVNPEFGTMEDWKNLVDKAHTLDMKIILDWVGNHTAWDHPWMEAHPDWYTRNEKGKVISPVDDWSDVADLNFDNMELREAMLQALEFWVKETEIDGYRCDVAMMIPMEFWVESRKRLDAIKPVFMLAEAEGPEFHEEAFDMTYGWEFHHLMNQVAKDAEPLSVFDTYLTKMDSTYPTSAYRMYFTTNHDENSWNGTVFERMGENHKNFFILSATFPYGMPLIYSGQEGGLDKRLAFFEKDSISWSDSSLTDFYERVIHLKRTHPALLNGKDQGNFVRIDAAANNKTYSYIRKAEGKRILVFMNFADTESRIDVSKVRDDIGTEYLSSGFHALENDHLRLGPNAFVIMTED